MKCPLCKYEPKLKKNGDYKAGQEGWQDISVPIIDSEVFIEPHDNNGKEIVACPKCGVVFMGMK